MGDPHHRWPPNFGHLPPGGGLTPSGGNFPGQFPEPGRFGVSRSIDDQRIGDVTKLPGFAPGTPVEAYPSKRLLKISLQEIAAASGHPDKQWETGSWELVLQASVTQPWNRNGFFCVCPLIAKILMGVGGGTTSVEISAFPSAAIPLPCDMVQVDVTWDPFRSADYSGASFGPLAVPGEVQVTATIQRSTGSSDARRVFVASPGDVAGTNIFGLVPAVAKRCMVYNTNNIEIYAAGAQFFLQASDTSEVLAGFPTTISTYSGPQLLGIRNQGALVDVPGQARRWNYIGDGGVFINDGPVFVDFEIGL